MQISVVTPTICPDGLEVIQHALSNQTFQNFEWLVEVSIPEKGHDLNAAYNRMLKRAKGELIVSVQDFVEMPYDGLEKFWKAYQENPDTFFTAPLGKKLGEHVKWDWRETDAEMDWRMWEIDWAAAPLEALKKVGGFDEALDEYWSSDNVSVGHRANLHGYKFKNIKDNKALVLDHDAFMEHPFRKNYNPSFANDRMRSVEMEEIKIEL